MPNSTSVYTGKPISVMALLRKMERVCAEQTVKLEEQKARIHELEQQVELLQRIEKIKGNRTRNGKEKSTLHGDVS